VSADDGQQLAGLPGRGGRDVQPDSRRNEKLALMETMTKRLPVLRATVGISQGELAEYVGISRQTYCALEQGKRGMSWNVFLALFLFFLSNTETNELLKKERGYIAAVYRFLQYRPE
jgi:DNA-binding XRE family transcriptional regulator